MVEGEELGSNLLRVAKSGLWGPGGPPRGTRPRPERETAKSPKRQCRATIRLVHPGLWTPCQTHIEPP